MTLLKKANFFLFLYQAIYTTFSGLFEHSFFLHITSLITYTVGRGALIHPAVPFPQP